MLRRQILLAKQCSPISPILLLQSRTNTVNFFQRRTEEVLWNTVTSITKYGARKGGAVKRPRFRSPAYFYRVGTIKASPIRMRYPGLNAQADESQKIEDPNISRQPMFIEEQPEEEERLAKLRIIKTSLENAPKRPRRIKENPKLTPLERGFTGGQWLGQRLGCPPERDGVEFGDFDCICFEVRRLATMHSSFGRVQFMRVLVFIGNGNGVGGWAIARCPMFRNYEGVARAIKQATRNLFFVERFEDRTIHQDFFAECNNTRIFAQRQEPGYGVIAHPRIKKICELLGIHDIYVRVDGTTSNYVAACQAFVTGLINQETHQQCADRTRLHIVELDPNRLYYPRIVASPMNAPVKSDAEVEPKERMRLEDFYGEGRFPLHWGPKLPSWHNEAGHLHKQWKIYPYRNMENRIVRLMADGTVNRWTRRERQKWTDMEQWKVENGLKPVPMGIGLTDYVPMEGEDEPAPFLGDLQKFTAIGEEGDFIDEDELEQLAMTQGKQEEGKGPRK